MKVSLSIFNFSKKPFVAKLIGFLLILVVVDWTVGGIVGMLYRNAPYGANWTKENWLLNNRFDVVVFGSSRALRHYDPKIMEEALGLTVFNAGQNGQYMLYSYALEQLLLDRYSPRLIILDILPSFIIKVENPDEEFERLATLSPFIGNPTVRFLLTRGEFYEGLKYTSRMFRYNSKILSILDNYRAQPANVVNGYEYVGDVRFHDRNPFIVDQLEHVEIDSFKLRILQKFMTHAAEKHIPVVACISPVSSSVSARVDSVLNIYSHILEDLGVPFLNFADAAHNEFWDKDLYIDLIHLDEKGAELFSREFASELLPILNQSSFPLAVRN